MAADTYTSKVIVLRKTKLGESDLILSMLAEDGSQLKAVAKGARKPSNTFAARLELYSIAEVLCSKGRNLDIVKEAKLLESNEKLRCEMEYAAGAAPMVELLDKTVQAGLESPRLFDLTRVALSSLCEVDALTVPSITAAHLLKTFAFTGLRPSFSVCALCGNDIVLEDAPDYLKISYLEGGVLCEQCVQQAEGALVQTEMCRWAQLLLSSTFAQISEYAMDTHAAFEVLQFCQLWTREHVGTNLKSLNFMFTGGMYTQEL